MASDELFPGQYFDQETGLHYNYFRMYDPKNGRYDEADPIGLAAGTNPFLYANANPIRFTDPLGLDAIPGPYGIPIPFIPPSFIRPQNSQSDNVDNSGTSSRTRGRSDRSRSQRCNNDNDDCEKLNRIDTDTCNAISRIRSPAAGAACHKSASDRYAACLRGQPLPPLNTWNN